MTLAPRPRIDLSDSVTNRTRGSLRTPCTLPSNRGRPFTYTSSRKLSSMLAISYNPKSGFRHQKWGMNTNQNPCHYPDRISRKRSRDAKPPAHNCRNNNTNNFLTLTEPHNLPIASGRLGLRCPCTPHPPPGRSLLHSLLPAQRIPPQKQQNCATCGIELPACHRKLDWPMCHHR